MKHIRRPTRAAEPQGKSQFQNNGYEAPDLKPGKFQLEAPFAKSVQLAAHFTNWAKSPVDLMKVENGLWMLVLPLPPGRHPYRFLVDGQWYNDPRAIQTQPNPYGTENSVIVVT